MSQSSQSSSSSQPFSDLVLTDEKLRDRLHEILGYRRLTIHPHDKQRLRWLLENLSFNESEAERLGVFADARLDEIYELGLMAGVFLFEMNSIVGTRHKTQSRVVAAGRARGAILRAKARKKNEKVLEIASASDNPIKTVMRKRGVGERHARRLLRESLKKRT